MTVQVVTCKIYRVNVDYLMQQREFMERVCGSQVVHVGTEQKGKIVFFYWLLTDEQSQRYEEYVDLSKSLLNLAKCGDTAAYRELKRISTNQGIDDDKWENVQKRDEYLNKIAEGK